MGQWIQELARDPLSESNKIRRLSGMYMFQICQFISAKYIVGKMAKTWTKAASKYRVSQASSRQVTGLWNKEPLKVLNDTKLIKGRVLRPI